MTHIAESFGLWLADYYLLSTALLVVALGAMLAIKQPAKRLAVVKATLVGLFLLAALCSLPNWSLIHLTRSHVAKNEAVREVPREPRLSTAAEAAQPDLVAPPLPVQPSAPTVEAEAHIERNWHMPELNWRAILAIAHVFGAVCVALRLALGLLAASRLRGESQPARSELIAILTEVATSGKRLATAQLLASDRIDVAVALGVRRPSIILPARWIDGRGRLSNEQLRSVLAHEWAHVTNHDLPWLAVSRSLTLLLWAQPLYWLMRRRMRLDQESLADAAAAEVTNRERYAEQLVAWARTVGSSQGVRLASAVGLWEGPSQLRQRIALLIDDGFTVLRSCPRGWRRGTAVFGILCTFLLSLLTIEPASSVDVKDAPPPAAADQKAADEQKPSSEVTADFFVPENVKPSTPNEIAGQCLDDSSKPVAGVEIQLARVSTSTMNREAVAKQTSDSDGRFAFKNVVDLKSAYPDGKIPVLPDFRVPSYVVSARSEGHASAETALQRDQVAKNGSTVTLTMSPAATLDGRVLDSDGKPVAGALVSISQPDRWEGFQSALTDSDGKYSIKDAPRVKSGKIVRPNQKPLPLAPEGANTWDVSSMSDPQRTITVSHPEYASRWVQVKDVPGKQDITVERSAIISGRVLYGDSGKPVAGATVQAFVSKGHEPPPAELSQSPMFANVSTDSDGRYKITSLRPGTYDISAVAPDWVTTGLRLIKTSTDQSTSVPDLSLTRGGTIRARLVDRKTDKPVDLAGDARLQLYVEHPTMRAFPTMATLQARGGRFELQAAPGKNRILQATASSAGEIKWIGGLAANAPVDIDVTEGQTADVDVPVVDVEAFSQDTQNKQKQSSAAQPANGSSKSSSQAGSVNAKKKAPREYPRTPNAYAGRLFDDKAQPVAEVDVFLFRLNANRRQRTALGQTKTDADGRFRFDNVLDVEKEFPGRKFPASLDMSNEIIQVYFRKAGYATASMGERLQAVAQFGVNQPLMMQPAATLKGRITSPDGKPVADARVSVGTGITSGEWEGAYSARTDADGRYTINDYYQFDNATQPQIGSPAKGKSGQADYVLFKAATMVLVEHPDFATKKTSIAKVPSTKDIELERPAYLEGQVKFADSGKPAANAAIEAVTFFELPDNPSEQPKTPTIYRAATQTDAEGKYRIISLPAGKYNICADLQGWFNNPAIGIEAESDKTASVPDMAFSKGGIISVRLVDSKSGKPVPLEDSFRAAFVAQPDPRHPVSRWTPNEWLSANKDGRFETRAAPGKQSISVSAVVQRPELKMQYIPAEPAVIDVVDGQTVSVDLKVNKYNENNFEATFSAPQPQRTKSEKLKENTSAQPSDPQSNDAKSTTDLAKALTKVRILVVDESGKPIEGASIEPLGLASSPESTEILWKQTTGKDGKAAFPFPRAMIEQYGVNFTPVRVTHPDFVAVTPQIETTAKETTVKLARGGVVEITAHADVSGDALGEIYGLESTLDLTIPWTYNGDGKIRSPQLPVGERLVRAVAFPKNGVALFSDVKEVNVIAGKVTPIDVTLKPGWRLTGKLGDQAPRPVLNGRVMLVNESDNGTGWCDSTVVREDGTFEFASLPDNATEVGLTAICDGFVSKVSDEDGKKYGMMMRQKFPSNNISPCVVEMMPAAKCAVTVHDTKGKPIPGVRVTIQPPIMFANGGTSWFSGQLGGTKQILVSKTYRSTMDREVFPYEAITGDDGIVELRNLPPFETYLSAGNDKYELPRNPIWALHGVPPIPFVGVKLRPGETTRPTLTLLPIEGDLDARPAVSRLPVDSNASLVVANPSEPLRVLPAAHQSVEKTARDLKPPAILKYGDGKADGKKSYGGSGHMILFEMPDGITKAKGLRIHGSRYGLPQAPDEDFEITFLSEDLKETLDTKAAPYRLFKRGKENWVRVLFDKEVELPKKFWVALNFNAHQTKGVYVSYDTSTKGKYSRAGLPGDDGEPKPTDFGGDWMVQVMLISPPKDK